MKILIRIWYLFFGQLGFDADCGFNKTPSLYAKINTKTAEAVNMIHCISHILCGSGQ